MVNTIKHGEYLAWLTITINTMDHHTIISCEYLLWFTIIIINTISRRNIIISGEYLL